LCVEDNKSILSITNAEEKSWVEELQSYSYLKKNLRIRVASAEVRDRKKIVV